MASAIIALGGNVGDVRATFKAAIADICTLAQARLLARSSDYATPPWGEEQQPPFVNACIEIETELAPHALLDLLLAVERKFGRDRTKERRWGPRTLDLDLIAYDDLALQTETLTLPHPRVLQRAFVLVPLAEIAPEREIGRRSVKAALAELSSAGIERLPAPETSVWLDRPAVAISAPTIAPGVNHRMTSATDLPLASDFPQAAYDDWRKLADGVLKGAPFEKLVGKSYDGLKIEPIYRRATNATLLPGRAAAAPWQKMQRIDHPDAAKANAIALAELENGATGLEIEFAGGPGARGFGVVDATPETLKKLFDGVMFDAGISIALNPVVGRHNAGESLATVIEARRIDPAKVDIRFNYQALSTMAVQGAAPSAWRDMAPPFAKVVSGLMGRGFKGPFVLACGRPVHDAGGSEAQELAFALSLAVAYLRMLEAGGIALEAARAALSFRLVADADQFLTMAKFRALRLLWARVEQACGLTPEPVFIAAETAWRMLTQRDADVNMLRATMATFAAGLAGANAITVLPHTLACGLPDAFARRVARNTQLILLEESNLAKVSDPAAGSGGVESLTQQLSNAAWALFQEIETAGGVFEALQQGLIQGKVAATRSAREANVARRKDVLTGASEFPNLREVHVTVEDVKPVVLAPPTATISFAPLAATRLAAPFERLRDRSDEILKNAGKRPSVFLANLGRASDFTARATFAKSFFESGGIEAIDSEGSSDASALAAACKASGAGLACLCSSDKVYDEQAAEAAGALQTAGIKHIYLAGRPGELEAALKAAGVGAFIFAGSDALAVLEDAYRKVEQP